LRVILKRCFDLESYSLYGDEEFPSPPIRELVGEMPVGPDARNFVQWMTKQKRTMCVKTHGLPGPDTHRAIYIVREGRAALVSYCHYLRDFLGRNVSLEAAIAGDAIPPWSDHVAAWVFSGRPNVLVIRYEELILARADLLEKISQFIGRPALRQNDISFSDLHRLMPAFFRCGSNERNIDEMTAQQLKLFDSRHGLVQARMGYPRSVPLPVSVLM